jgi:hypothetical protein
MSGWGVRNNWSESVRIAMTAHKRPQKASNNIAVDCAHPPRNADSASFSLQKSYSGFSEEKA